MDTLSLVEINHYIKISVQGFFFFGPVCLFCPFCFVKNQKMSRLSKKQPSVCTAAPLTDSNVSQKLAVLHQILTSCLGPSGRLKQIHNDVGGHVLTTSTSSVLLKAVQLSHPVPKLLAAAVLNHTSRFGDCGLFAGVLCSALLVEARRLMVEPPAVATVYRQLLGLCTTYLTQEDCSCKVRVEFSSSRDLLTLTRSVLTSKPACMLTQVEAEHIVLQVVQAFLLTVPSSTTGRVRLGTAVTHLVEGQPPMASTALVGLLVDMPEQLRAADVERLGADLRVALFSTSLAGDLAEEGDGSLEVHGETIVEEAVLQQLLELGEQLVTDGVRLLACQKVVHPVLRHMLRGRGLVVAERLGLALMEPFVQMTGAQPVATFQVAVPFSCYGCVGTLGVHRCGSRELLHLLPAGDPAVCTLVLCHRSETSLDELKVTCQTAEQVLRQTLKEPSALLGGGCTESHLASYIRHKSKTVVTQATSDLGCSRSDYLLAAEGFCRSLEATARALESDTTVSLMDLCHAHRWPTSAAPPPGVSWAELVGSCGCGLISGQSNMEWTPLGTGHEPFPPAPLINTASQPHVLDSFPAKLNALQVAVETANLILDLKYIIQDKNELFSSCQSGV
ncbi:molecular chaperone MKKS isoform X2 [Scleropages formosus]|uniref:MKKS centrosomal shuttling protein n=1 Tax=Scleropages formosus TaxID=113540 RepID=A0A8C9RML0_SCLFO|nr:McKusick-Kaufman/Bardet-Biedl syndromes putative chaperonin isoform X2 [Scleropages formosus]